eukprot:Clim_evm8s218 gene=Clim_evmTU8s218
MHEAMRGLIAEVLLAEGFSGAGESTIHAFQEAVEQHLQEIAGLSNEYAGLRGRMGINALDVMASCQGGRSAEWDAFDSRDETMKRNVGRLQRFLDGPARLPPRYKAPPKFIKKEEQLRAQSGRESVTNLAKANEVLGLEAVERPSQFPDYLPPLPAAHTFLATPVADQKLSDPAYVRKVRSEQLHNLQSSLSSMVAELRGSETISISLADDSSFVAKVIARPSSYFDALTGHQ